MNKSVYVARRLCKNGNLGTCGMERGQAGRNLSSCPVFFPERPHNKSGWALQRGPPFDDASAVNKGQPEKRKREARQARERERRKGYFSQGAAKD